MESITLRFKSAEAKEEFLGQLSDGIGENWVVLRWPKGTKIGDQEVIDVMVFADGGSSNEVK